jgi:hypothetical protein
MSSEMSSEMIFNECEKIIDNIIFQTMKCITDGFLQKHFKKTKYILYLKIYQYYNI